MIVRLKLFAVAKELIGAEAAEVELADGATIADLRAAIETKFPALSETASHLMFAIDAEYAGDDSVIPPDAEVACIPPVSGG